MDRLEYLIWRDTIKYKYQLNEGEGLSEEYIENKISELEKTINESMPYFFKGKDTYENNIDDVYFIGHGYNEKMYIVLLDDFNSWKYNDKSNDELDPLLFCGDLWSIVLHEVRKTYKHNTTEDSQDVKSQRENKINQANFFSELSKTPLRRYSQIMKVIRSSEYFNKIDFSNYNAVKELFMKYNIFTFDVFSKQDGYEFCFGHYMQFILSNGINVVGFGYKMDDKYFYDKKRGQLLNKNIIDFNDDEDNE